MILGGREFTPVEHDDTDEGKKTAGQKDDLGEGDGKFAPGHTAAGAKVADGRKAFDDAEDVEQYLETICRLQISG